MMSSPSLSETFNQLHQNKVKPSQFPMPSSAKDKGRFSSLNSNSPTMIPTSVRHDSSGNTNNKDPRTDIFNNHNINTNKVNSNSNSRYIQQYLVNLLPPGSSMSSSSSPSLPSSSYNSTTKNSQDYLAPSSAASHFLSKSNPSSSSTSPMTARYNTEMKSPSGSAVHPAMPTSASSNFSNGNQRPGKPAYQNNQPESTATVPEPKVEIKSKSRYLKKALLDKDLPPLPCPPGPSKHKERAPLGPTSASVPARYIGTKQFRELNNQGYYSDNEGDSSEFDSESDADLEELTGPFTYNNNLSNTDIPATFDLELGELTAGTYSAKSAEELVRLSLEQESETSFQFSPLLSDLHCKHQIPQDLHEASKPAVASAAALVEQTATTKVSINQGLGYKQSPVQSLAIHSSHKQPSASASLAHKAATSSLKSQKRASWHKPSASLPNALPSQDSMDIPPLPLKSVNSFQNLRLRFSSKPTDIAVPLSPTNLQELNLMEDNHQQDYMAAPPLPSAPFSIPSRSFPLPSPLPVDKPPKRPTTSPPPLFPLKTAPHVSLMNFPSSSSRGVSQLPSSNTASMRFSKLARQSFKAREELADVRKSHFQASSKAKPVTIDVQKANEPFLAAYSVNRPVLRKAKSQALLTRSPASVNYNTYSDLSNHNHPSPSSSTFGIINQARNMNSNFHLTSPDLINEQQFTTTPQNYQQLHDSQGTPSPAQLSNSDPELDQSVSNRSKRHSITSYVPVSVSSSSPFHAYSSPTELTSISPFQNPASSTVSSITAVSPFAEKPSDNPNKGSMQSNVTHDHAKQLSSAAASSARYSHSSSPGKKPRSLHKAEASDASQDNPLFDTVSLRSKPSNKHRSDHNNHLRENTMYHEESDVMTRDVSDPKVQKRIRTKYNLIRELVKTEETFSTDIGVVVDMYSRRLMKKPYCNYVSSRDVQALFTNLDQVLLLSRRFVAHLRECIPSYILNECDLTPPVENESSKNKIVLEDIESYIGQVILEYIPSLEMTYKVYCAQSQFQLNTFYRINTQGCPMIDKWLLECRNASKSMTQAWTLDALLIKPVQRLMKYPLLLNSMLEVTSPEHLDYAVLEEALNQMQDTANRINSIESETFFMDYLDSPFKTASDAEDRTATIDTNPESTLTDGPTDYNTAMSQLKDNPHSDNELEILLVQFDRKQRHVKNLIKYLRGSVTQVQKHFDTNSALAHAWVNWSSATDDAENLVRNKKNKIYRRFAMFSLPFTTSSSAHVSTNRLQQRIEDFVIDPLQDTWMCYYNTGNVINRREKLHSSYSKYVASKAASASTNEEMQLDPITLSNADKFIKLHNQLKMELPELFSMTEDIIDSCLVRFLVIQRDWFRVAVDSTSNVFGLTLADIRRSSVEDEDPIVATFHRGQSKTARQTIDEDLTMCHTRLNSSISAISSNGSGVSAVMEHSSGSSISSETSSHFDAAAGTGSHNACSSLSSTEDSAKFYEPSPKVENETVKTPPDDDSTWEGRTAIESTVSATPTLSSSASYSLFPTTSSNNSLTHHQHHQEISAPDPEPPKSTTGPISVRKSVRRRSSLLTLSGWQKVSRGLNSNGRSAHVNNGGSKSSNRLSIMNEV